MRIKMKWILALILLTSQALAKDNSYHELTDMIGRKVLLPKNIKRVVTLGGVPVLNAFLFTLGKGETIVNGLPAFAIMPKRTFQYLFAPHLKKLEVMRYGSGIEPNIESLLKAKPDVILLMDFHKALGLMLAKKGFKVVFIKWSEKADIRPAMHLLGLIFDEEKRANAYVEYVDRVVLKAKELTKNIKEEEKVRAFFLNLDTFKGQRISTMWWIKAAGGLLADKDRKLELKTYDLEQILKINPDLIMVRTRKGLNELKDDTRFKSLKAVQNNKLYLMPRGAHVWGNSPSVEQPLFILWGLNKFYPKLYSEEELIKDVHFFYKRFFDTDLSTKLIEELLEARNK